MKHTYISNFYQLAFISTLIFMSILINSQHTINRQTITDLPSFPRWKLAETLRHTPFFHPMSNRINGQQPASMATLAICPGPLQPTLICIQLAKPTCRYRSGRPSLCAYALWGCTPALMNPLCFNHKHRIRNARNDSALGVVGEERRSWAVYCLGSGVVWRYITDYLNFKCV